MVLNGVAKAEISHHRWSKYRPKQYLPTTDGGCESKATFHPNPLLGLASKVGLESRQAE
jgi:hypothetical protein